RIQLYRTAAPRQQKTAQNNEKSVRFWDNRSNPATEDISRQHLSEVRREQIEVDRVHRAAVIEVAIEPCFTGLTEAAGQKVEVDRIDRATEIRIAVERVAEQNGGIVNRLPGEGRRKAREDIRRF